MRYEALLVVIDLIGFLLCRTLRLLVERLLFHREGFELIDALVEIADRAFHRIRQIFETLALTIPVIEEVILVIGANGRQRSFSLGIR